MKASETIPVILGSVCILLGVAWFADGGSVKWMGIPGLFAFGLLALAINWLAFIPAVLLRTETFYDLVGTATYMTLIGVSLYLMPPSAHGFDRRIILAICVGIWALRLGAFLVSRVHDVGKDGRFDEIKHNTLQFLMSWTIQALWAFLVSLPVLIIISRENVPQSELHPLDVVGWSLWLKGFIIEVVADRQKERFRTRTDPEKTWIDEGLWAYAQHPNYFGEVLLWTGLFVSGVHIYEGSEWLAILSPIFILFILTKVSGIPMVRARCEAKWGDDPEYRAYRARTHLMVPFPWPKKRG